MKPHRALGYPTPRPYPLEPSRRPPAAFSTTPKPPPLGRLLGFVMMANLLAAHAVRFKFNWKQKPDYYALTK